MLSVLRVVMTALVIVGAASVTAEPASAKNVTRYFEVRIQAAGQLDSGADCFGGQGDTVCPLGQDYLVEHDLSWGWLAYALVVAQRVGSHTTMHVIGPTPRVAAYFTENTDYASSTHDSCFADFSTGDKTNLTRYLAMPIRFEDDNGHVRIGLRAVVSSHFARCGQGTVSQHGRDATLASWDGLKGPWDYAGVRGPTRYQVLHKPTIVDLAWSQGLGVTHSAGGWPHKSGGGSSLVLAFTRFAGGQSSVFRYERGFARRHPINSAGFREYSRFA
jgi:hypothetical protein